MRVVGLTGGIGSGKSTVADLFSECGIDIIDADLIAREVVMPGEPALQQIVDHFGSNILDKHGCLRRHFLRELIFANPRERNWLEQLLHPLINERIRNRLSTSRSPYCILMSPLLLETGQKELIDRVLVVDASRETQLQRAMARDDSSRKTIEAILDAQLSRQARLEAADDVIQNDGHIDELKAQVEALNGRYLSLSA